MSKAGEKISQAGHQEGFSPNQLWPESPDAGLLIGYGNLKDTAIDRAVAALAEIVRSCGRSDEFGQGSASNRHDRTQDPHA